MVTRTPMVGIITEIQNKTKSVAKNILKTSIPPKKGSAHGEEIQDSKKKKKKKRFHSN